MWRCIVPMLLLISSTSNAQNMRGSDSLAIALAQKSIAALTAGASIRDVTLNANVISVLGADYKTGTATFQAKAGGRSRVSFHFRDASRIEIRNTVNGIPVGSWKDNKEKAKAYAQHNCWSEAAWFFPALSSLTQVANAHFVFRYLGAMERNGIPVQHLRIVQVGGANDLEILPRLSATDFFLNAYSYLPVAITFSAHPDNNMNVNIPAEIDFATYQSVNGVLVPLHFQRLLSGTVILDVNVSRVDFSNALSDNLFSLQ